MSDFMLLINSRVALSLLCLAAGVAGADAQAQRKVHAKPGEEIRIGVFATVQKNCKAGALPTVKLKQAPANGNVAVKQGRVRATNLKECLAIEVPAFVAVYKSKPDFTGEDEVLLEVIDGAGKSQTHSILVVVQRAPAERPAIKRAPLDQGI